MSILRDRDGPFSATQAEFLRKAEGPVMVEALSSESIAALLESGDVTEDEAKAVSPSVIGELPVERLKQLLRIRKCLTPAQMKKVKGDQVQQLTAIDGEDGESNEFLMFLLSAVETPDVHRAEQRVDFPAQRADTLDLYSFSAGTP